MIDDLRLLLRLGQGRDPQPSAAIFDAQTRQARPESRAPAGYDGHKRKNGSKIYAAVDTLGHLFPLHVTPANARDRDQVAQLAAAVQAATVEHVKLAFVDQGYSGEVAAEAAAAHGIVRDPCKFKRAFPKNSYCLP
jgi:hypothetical protein